MDFNEIKRTKFDNLQELRKLKKNNKQENTPANDQIAKANLPTDPNYWKSTIGVKPLNISFTGSNIEQADDSYINEKILQLNSIFYWLSKEDIEAEHKAKLQELKLNGKNALDNYVAIISQTAFYIFSEEETKNFKELVVELLKAIPDLNSECTGQITMALRQGVELSTGIDFIKTLIRDIVSRQDIPQEEKVFWFTNTLDKIYYNRAEHVNDDVDFHKERADSYFNLAKVLNSDSKYNKALLSFTPKQMDNISIWLKDGRILPENFTNFLKYDISSLSNVYRNTFLSEIIDELQEDDTKVEIFSRLIQPKMFKYKISSAQICNLLKQDTDFLISLLNEISQNMQEDGSYKFSSAGDLIRLIQYLNISNLKDFIDIYKGQSTTDSIYDAAYNINPKTGLFDRRILEKSREMEGNGISQLYTNQTALSCIDLKTGEFSPVAQELVDFFYPPRNSTAMKSLKNSIKNQYITWSKVDFDLEDNPSFLIDCLKNKDGEFDEVNLNYVFKIIKMYRSVFSCITVYFSDIVDIMNYIKDENGVADKNKFNNIKSIYKMLPHQDDVIRIVKALEKFPEEKRKSIFETCSSLGQYEDVVSLNFEVLSGFCFDKDGNKIQSNIDYIMELFEINGEFVFHQEFIDICVKNPELRRFLQEVLSNFKNENCLDKIKDVIPAYQREDGSIPDFVKDKILEYTKSGRDLNGFTDVFNYCLRQTNGNYESGFNYDMFNKVLDFRKLARAAKSFKVINYANEYINIVNGNLNLGHMDFKDKVSILNGLTKIQEYIEKNNISGYDYIEKSISTIEAGLKLEDIALPIDKETKTEFLANILFSREDYTGFEQIMIDSIPVLESMNEGLTLAYPRAEFLNDLTLICQNDEDIEILKQKAGIVPIFSDKGQRIIVGYNGLIKLSDLDVNNPKEKQIYDCLSKFMYKNEVKTGNKALDEQLNIIIKTCPEFINTIGKKQHATHEYTLDIHSLLVMAYSMANPDYNRKLNSLDKTLLKISAIFHDIMKQENVVDKGHQNLSSLYTRSIIQKIFNSPEIQDRVFGLVDNHHWGEELSNTPDFERTAKELAFKFRRPNDFEIAKIMADSDLRAVSENFYEHRKGNLTSDKLDIIGKNIKYLYSNGNAVFSDYFVSPSSLEKHIQIKDGRSYKVVNMNSIPDNADMGEYGFRSGIKKTDLRFLVHMVDERDIYNNLNTVKLLTSPFNGGVLSESLISPKYNRTYSNREYGLLLSQENVNIVNEASSNQGSGIKKGFSKIIDLVFNNNFAEDRNNFKSQLLYYLGINPKDVSSEDYAEFYKNVLSAKTSLQQISTEKIYKLGSFSITGGDLIKAIKEYQDGLIDKQEKKHNEIIGYIPKIHAVIAKGKSINALPEGLLNFAYENNYPIILI